MSETKKCSKCSGDMSEGSLKKIGYFGNPPYQWAPVEELPIPLKGAENKRREVQIYRCGNCGFLESYAK